MIEVQSSQSRMGRESEGAGSSEATFHPRISQNGVREEKWECQFHISSTQQRLIRVGLRAPIQCATCLTIINKAIITLNSVEGSRANPLDIGFRDVGFSPLSSHFRLISFPLCSLTLSLSLSFFISHATFISTFCYANLSGSRHIHISDRLYLNSLHWAEWYMCQETLEMSRISYNVLYIVVLIVSPTLTLSTRGACNTLHEYAFIFLSTMLLLSIIQQRLCARDACIRRTLNI